MHAARTSMRSVVRSLESPSWWTSSAHAPHAGLTVSWPETGWEECRCMDKVLVFHLAGGNHESPTREWANTVTCCGRTQLASVVCFENHRSRQRVGRIPAHGRSGTHGRPALQRPANARMDRGRCVRVPEQCHRSVPCSTTCGCALSGVDRVSHVAWAGTDRSDSMVRTVT